MIKTSKHSSYGYKILQVLANTSMKQTSLFYIFFHFKKDWTQTIKRKVSEPLFILSSNSIKFQALSTPNNHEAFCIFVYFCSFIHQHVSGFYFCVTKIYIEKFYIFYFSGFIYSIWNVYLFYTYIWFVFIDMMENI